MILFSLALPHTHLRVIYIHSDIRLLGDVEMGLSNVGLTVTGNSDELIGEHNSILKIDQLCNS